MLNRAIINNDEEKVKTLLEKGVVLNDDDAIKLALDNVELLTSLITNGANVNAIVDSDNNSLLEWAIKNKELPLVELLIQKGADINHVSKNSQDPLIFCAVKNLPESYMKLFFDRDPNLILARDKQNWPVYAVMLGKGDFNALIDLKTNKTAFDILLKQSDIMSRLISGWSEDKKCEEFADFLVLNGYDLNSGYSYLQYSIWELNFDAFQWLLKNGISPVNINVDPQLYYGYGTPAEVIGWRKSFVRHPKEIAVNENPMEPDFEKIAQEEAILRDMEQLLEEEIRKMGL
jgi:hypothetical protein